MRIYTCCPNAGCTGYRDAMAFLERWGIEPEIGHDDDGHFFQFEIPSSWSSRKMRAFANAMAGLTSELPPENGGAGEF